MKNQTTFPAKLRLRLNGRLRTNLVQIEIDPDLLQMLMFLVIVKAFIVFVLAHSPVTPNTNMSPDSPTSNTH